MYSDETINLYTMQGVLITRGGKTVAKFRMPRWKVLPDAVAWGARMFRLTDPHDADPVRYTEIFCWPVIDIGMFGMIDPELRTDG